MTKKQNLSIGICALSLMLGMNFTHALDKYGFLSKHFCQKIWADGTSESTTTGSYNPPSTEKKPGNYDIKREDGTELKNWDPIKETVVVECLPNGKYECKSYRGYRHKNQNGTWGEWHPA